MQTNTGHQKLGASPYPESGLGAGGSWGPQATATGPEGESL